MDSSVACQFAWCLVLYTNRERAKTKISLINHDGQWHVYVYARMWCWIESIAPICYRQTRAARTTPVFARPGQTVSPAVVPWSSSREGCSFRPVPTRSLSSTVSAVCQVCQDVCGTSGETVPHCVLYALGTADGSGPDPVVWRLCRIPADGRLQ